MKLGSKLAEWHQANLISAEQAREILAFEQKRNRSANWIILALGAVGALGVVTGIISLIAANWDEIPAPVKLAAALALLVGSLAAAYGLSREGKTLASDLFLAAHAGLVLAMIGLVGQVYHLSGAPWRALALAAAMALPAAAIAEHSVLSDVAIGYTLSALALFLGESRAARPSLEGFGWGLLAAAVAGALLLLAQALRHLHPPAGRALLRWGGGLLLAVAVAAAFSWSVGWSGETRPPMIVLSAAVALAWIARLAWAREGALAVAAVALAALIIGAAWTGGRHTGGAWEAAGPGMRFLGFA
ncbi:MAG TPA: DUF2157 domain-containing protein, partial [Myxococcales bacterium]|nr:DUF2157 domain-containing protein [Myxococcales bacterium]